MNDYCISSYSHYLEFFRRFNLYLFGRMELAEITQILTTDTEQSCKKIHYYCYFRTPATCGDCRLTDSPL